MLFYLAMSAEFRNFEVVNLASFAPIFTPVSDIQVKPHSFISGQKFLCPLYVVGINVNVSQVQCHGLQRRFNLSRYQIQMVNVSWQT